MQMRTLAKKSLGCQSKASMYSKSFKAKLCQSKIKMKSKIDQSRYQRLVFILKGQLGILKPQKKQKLCQMVSILIKFQLFAYERLQIQTKEIMKREEDFQLQSLLFSFLTHKINKMYQCALCNGSFKNKPRVIKCQHIVCSECINQRLNVPLT